MKKRPPKLGPDTIRAIAEDLRKGGLGLMATGFVGVMQLVAKFSMAGSVLFVAMGLMFWTVAIVLHSIYEQMNRQGPEE